MRIIPKQEVYTEAKSSLAGTCAVRMYYDGNITFSKQASDLLNFTDNKYFQISENDKSEIFLVPNKTEGYKVALRKQKLCYLYYSKPIINYLSKRFKTDPAKNKPLEFLISKSKEKVDGNICFKITLQKQ